MSLSKENTKYAIIAGTATVVSLLGYGFYTYMSGAGPNKQAESQDDLATLSFFKDANADKMSYLYKKEAMQRSADISDVEYKVAYALLRGGETFHGQVDIKFSLSATSCKSENIFCDYRGEKVLWLTVNGQKATKANLFRDHRIYFPVDLLKEGENIV